GAGGVRSSWTARATGAGPRVSASACTFRIRLSPPCVRRSRSPTRTSLAGFAAPSLTSTLPPAHAAAARLRVLKKRAAQSHLSTRSESGESVTPNRYHSAWHDLGDLHELRAGPRRGHSPPPRRNAVAGRPSRRRGLTEAQA